MKSNRALWAEALMLEGCILPIDEAVRLMGEGVDVTMMEARIEGFDVESYLDNLDEIDYE